MDAVQLQRLARAGGDLQGRAKALMSQLPPVSQALGIVSVVLTLIGWLVGSRDDIPGFRPYLAASGYTLPPSFFVWTLVTAGVFETDVINLFVNLIAVVMAAKYFENIWGSTELLKFVTLVNAVAAGITVFVQVFTYVVTFQADWLYGTQVNGHVPLLMAFAVAFKQLVPENTIDGLPLRVRTKDVPLIVLVVFLLRYLLFGRVFMAFYTFFGFFAGWAYLRFFQMRDGVKGDRSETFAFAMFFPESVQPPVRAAATVVFRFLVLMRLCERIEPRTTEEIEMEEAIHVRRDLPSAVGADPGDAERRRQKALFALEKRIATAQPQASKDGLSSPGRASPRLDAVPAPADAQLTTQHDHNNDGELQTLVAASDDHRHDDH